MWKPLSQSDATLELTLTSTSTGVGLTIMFCSVNALPHTVGQQSAYQKSHSLRLLVIMAQSQL